MSVLGKDAERSLFLILDFIGVHPVIQIGLPESNDTPHLEVRDGPGLNLLVKPWHRNSEPLRHFRGSQNTVHNYHPLPTLHWFAKSGSHWVTLTLSYLLSFVFGDTFLVITASKKI